MPRLNLRMFCTMVTWHIVTFALACTSCRNDVVFALAGFPLARHACSDFECESLSFTGLNENHSHLACGMRSICIWRGGMRIIISAVSNIPTVDKVIFIMYNACYGVNLFLALLRGYNKAPFGACLFCQIYKFLAVVNLAKIFQSGTSWIVCFTWSGSEIVWNVQSPMSRASPREFLQSSKASSSDLPSPMWFPV